MSQMSETNQPAKPAKPAKQTQQDIETEIAEIDAVWVRANVADPDPADIKKIRQIFKDYPELCRKGIDFMERARDAIIDRMHVTGTLREFMRVTAKEMRNDLDWNNSGPLERVLIDAVILCHLRYTQTVESFERAMVSSDNIAVRDHWDKLLNSALKRLTRATEALAKVRKLGRRTPELLGDFTDRDMVM